MSCLGGKQILGLSREHIVYVLGVDLPLNESIRISMSKQEEIIEKQILFEQWYKTLWDTTKQAASAIASKVKSKVSKKYIQNITNIKELAEGLTLIFQYPTLVVELNQVLSDQLTKVTSPIVLFFLGIYNSFNEFLDGLEQTQKENPLVQGIQKIVNVSKSIYESLNSLLERFRATKGWIKTMLGLGAFSLVAFTWTKISKFINKMKEKISKKILGPKLLKLKQEIVSGLGKAQTKGIKAVGLGLTSGAVATVDDSLDNIIKEIDEKVLIPTVSTITSEALNYIFTSAGGAILSYITGFAKFVGGFAVFAGIVNPIVKQFVTKYNAIVAKEAGGGRARTASMGGNLSNQLSTTQKLTYKLAPIAQMASSIPLEENKVSLTKIIYENS